jgi:hypothetical protein
MLLKGDDDMKKLHTPYLESVLTTNSSSSKEWNGFLVMTTAFAICILIFESSFLYIYRAHGLSWSQFLVNVEAFVGPLSFASMFLIFIGLLLMACVLLVMDFLQIHTANKTIHLKILNYIITSSPLLGVVISFISLRNSQVNMDLSLPSKELIASVATNSGTAFGSSVVGLFIALAAMSIKLLFTFKRSSNEQ